MTTHHYTVVDELRSSTRFPKERGAEVAVIWDSELEPMLVDVRDESLGGLGVYVPDPDCFPVGREVDLVYAGEFFRARVCHVQPHEDGGIVGLACER